MTAVAWGGTGSGRAGRWVAGASCGVVIAAASLAVSMPRAQAAQSATAAPVGARPNATRVDFSLGSRAQASVDVGTGNLLVTTTELTLPGVAKDLQLGVDFNSLLLESDSPVPSGSAGSGFAMRIGKDTSMVEAEDGSVLYLAPDGREGVFTPDGSGGYDSPAEFKSTLVRSGGGWQLTDHGSSAVSVFNSAGRLTSVTDRNGNATTFELNGGTLTVTSTRGGSVSRVASAHFAYGRLTRLVQGNDQSGSREAVYGYDVSGEHLTSITDTGGGVTALAWDSGSGDLASVTEPGGLVTSFDYDGSHRVVSVSQGLAGETPAVTRLAYPSGSSTLVAGPTTDQGQAVAQVAHASYTLNAGDRPTTVVDELGRTRQASYTPFADVSSATDGTGATTSAAYGANGGESLTKVTSPTGASMQLGYGGTGSLAYQPTSATDTQGNSSVLSYDGVGNPAETVNDAGASASVAYRSDGTLKSATDPRGATTTYQVDSATKQVTGASPPSGSGLGGSSYGYDGYSRLAAVTDGRGVTTSYTYDDMDRVAKVDSCDGTGSVSYTYDAAGRLATRTDAAQQVTFGYDGLGRVTSRQSAPVGAGSAPAAASLSYDYDLAGNLVAATASRGETTYDYDAANQLVAMTPPATGQLTFEYNNAGRRTDTWWGASADHASFKAHTHTAFNASGRIKRMWTARDSSPSTRVFDTSYCYSPYQSGTSCPTGSATTDTGLLQYTTNHLDGTRADFTYDAANRLTKVTGWGGHTYAYAYDANGNRTQAKVDGSVTQTLTYNTGNQITSSGYGYDAAGNRTADPDAGALAYNGAGQMTSQSGSLNSTYTWGGTGQNELIAQDVPGSATFDYVYGRADSHGVPELETIIKGADTYTLDNDPTGAPLLLHTPNNETHFYVRDNVGTVVALIQGNGAKSANYTYDPYGTQLSQSGSSGTALWNNPYRHAGGMFDRGTTWIKHGTRWNDTTTGAWTTTDPITHLNDPSNANPYQYAGGNPINYIDPTGSIAWVADTLAVLLFVTATVGIVLAAELTPVALGVGVVGYLGSVVASSLQLSCDLTDGGCF